jgi:hypothetical protein
MTDAALAPGIRLGRTEFITLLAALIAINAFVIDIMLPGLQQIGKLQSNQVLESPLV